MKKNLMYSEMNTIKKEENHKTLENTWKQEIYSMLQVSNLDELKCMLSWCKRFSETLIVI